MVKTGKQGTGRVFVGISKDLEEGINEAFRNRNGSIGTRELVEELTKSRNISRDDARAMVVIALETGHVRCGKRLRLEVGPVKHRRKVA